jgi:hypothetical protein
MRFPFYVSVLLVTTVGTAARAGSPSSSQQAVEEELATIYASAAARPVLQADNPLARRVLAILEKQAAALQRQLHPWEHDSRARLLTSGASGEAGIRPNAHVAFGLAVLYRCTGNTQHRDDAIAILRFLLPTHSAGGMRCLDGKPWHSQWQSAYWAYSAGKAAWLLWDELEPHLKWLAARMICEEADRFVLEQPPHQIERDTKAEENAWNSTVIALANCMFPKHPRHAVWGEAASRWQINSFVTAADAKSAQVIDGRPLREWISGANIWDDYTLENHDRVHPDYMGTIRICLNQKFLYDWSAPPAKAPEAIELNAQRIYENLKKLALPDGNFIYPNGQDWQIHRNADWADLHSIMALRFGDPQAARLMRISIETAEKMLERSSASRSPAGETGQGIHLADEVLVPASHSILLELYADVYLYLRALGEGPEPVDEAQLWKQLSGTHVFSAGKFAVLRTEKSIATFSWGRQVMGMVLPLRKDLLLTPNDRSLIGNVAMKTGKRDTPIFLDGGMSSPGGGFAVCGVLGRGEGGSIRQRFAFIALPDGRTIYTDWFSAPATSEHMPLGVLNDRNWVYHDGKRTLRYVDGERVFRAADAANTPDAAFQSPWYNLDGLGIVCLNSVGPQRYRAQPSPIKARLEQLFVVNSQASVFHPDQPPERTAEIAPKCRFEPGVDALHYTLVLDDGKRIEIDLWRMKVTIP